MALPSITTNLFIEKIYGACPEPERSDWFRVAVDDDKFIHRIFKAYPLLRVQYSIFPIVFYNEFFLAQQNNLLFVPAALEKNFLEEYLCQPESELFSWRGKGNIAEEAVPAKQPERSAWKIPRE